jgi:hypothetical protein
MSDPILELSFHAGVDEATRDELVEPGRGWAELVNVRQDHRGAVSKRLAYAALPRTRVSGSRSAGNRLLGHRETVCTIDGTRLDVFAESAAVSAVSSLVPEASIEPRTLSSLASGSILFDVAQCNGYVAVAALRNTKVVVGVETATGVVVRSQEVVAISSVAETSALLASYSTHVILLVCDASSSSIVAYRLDTASPGSIAAGWVLVGNVATDKIDTGVAGLALSAESLADRIAFAYVNSSGGTSRITVRTITIAGLLETATVNTSSSTPDVVAVEGSIGDTLWIAWNEGANVKLQGRDADVLSTTIATTATAFSSMFATGGIVAPFIVSSSTPGQGRIAINSTSNAAGFGTPSAPVLIMATFATVGGAASVNTQEVLFGASMLARPVRVGTRYYGLFHGGTVGNGMAIFGDWTDSISQASLWIRPVGLAFPSLVAAAPLAALRPVVVSSDRVAYAVAVSRSASGQEFNLLTYDFAAPSRWRAAAHNRSLFLSGGVLSCFDGRRVAEAGFLYAPATPVAADSGSGVGVTGPVRYVVTFEEIDADGNECVSGVSLPSAPLTIADNAATVKVEPISISARLSASTDTRVRACLWRTTSSGEPPYYYVGEAANTTGGLISFTDTLPDSDLQTRRMLYGTGSLPGTNGSGQDRRSPPFCQDVASYNGMLVVASGSELWWSGQTVGGEGTWWNPAFVMPVDGPGNITALAVQDGTLVAFKDRSIYTLAGEAPSDNGAFGGLGAPRRLAVDVGCIDPRSVVVTSLGVFFRSERGIELLSRGGAVDWIGEKVQNTLAAFPVVSSAVLDDRGGLVRLSLAQGEEGGRVTGEGCDLVFDLTLGDWQSVDDKAGSGAHQASQDAAMVYVDGAHRYAWLGVDGTVYYEQRPTDETAHLDAGGWTTMAAVSPWVAIAGRNGEQFIDQVLLLAKRHTDHSLTFSVAFDFADSYANSKTFSYEQLSSLARQWLVREITQTTSQAVRVKLEDGPPTSPDPEASYDVASGKGATWVALTFNGQPHRGPKRSSGAQRGG